MASGSPCSAGERPPALPVKQHRSGSSADAECVPHQHDSYNNVFYEATDCHAAQCPVHRRYDPSRHQERYFSDGTPPPVPKKRSARPLSVPSSACPSWLPCPGSPLSPPQRLPQHFHNPLYMLAPARHSYQYVEEAEAEEVTESPAPSPPSFAQLTFDTPDDHLRHLFCSLDDRRGVSQGIQHRHLLFLRSVAQSVEARILLPGEEATEQEVRSHRPQDFMLIDDGGPQQIGDRVYYGLRCPRFPGRLLALQVHKRTDEPPTTLQRPHVNVQSVVAHFPLSSGGGGAQRKDSSSDVESRSSPDPLAADLTSAQSFLQRGLAVSVERDLPRGTLEDFVQEGRSHCVAYDRQVCVLMLQTIAASQHLYDICGAAAELRPREVFLVWPGTDTDKNKSEQGDDEEKMRSFQGCVWKEETGRGKGRIQILWGTRGSPRVVLQPRPSAPRGMSSIQSQIGALLRFCLAPPGSSASRDSGPGPTESWYRRGLLHLSSMIQNGPLVVDVAATLQALLWGPRGRDLSGPAAHNWLTIRRALLVMKLAERGLTQDLSAPDWEERMCLRYLSFAEPETVGSASSRLWLALKGD